VSPDCRVTLEQLTHAAAPDALGPPHDPIEILMLDARGLSDKSLTQFQ
jgi:hypothetical protein